MSDHAHAEHKESFISKYVFSQDHKMIARQFLITGITMGLIGGFWETMLASACPAMVAACQRTSGPQR